MNLPLLLITRLSAIAALGLALAIGWIVVDTHRSLQTETEASAQRVGKHLEALYWQEQLWHGRERSGLGSAKPEWQSFATLNLVSPGVCVTFALRGDAPQSLCSQTAALGRPAPSWFVAAYSAAFAPDAPVRRALFARNADIGWVVHAADRDAAIRQAWGRIASVAAVAAAMAVGIAMLAAMMIGQALRPARAIIDGLRRLESGDLASRLPAFRTAGFAQIGLAVNQLAGQLAKVGAERAALTTRLLDVQETERRALARDLHDEFGQCLTATGALAASIEAGAPAGRDDIVEEARAIGRTQERMMKTLRSTLVRLRSQDIDEVGLEASLRQLVCEHNLRTPSRSVYHLDVAGEIADVPHAIAIDVYRIAQECLTNAARHGSPSNVRLSVERAAGGPQNVAVTVQDDGGGDPGPLARDGGHGILGMRERLAALGGSFAISKVLGGVRVAAVIPLSAHGDARSAVAAA